MVYVSLTGLESYMGAEACAAWRSETPNAQGELEHCETRLLAMILPARPAGAAQIEAFSRAVYAQIEHEARPACRQMADMPEGVKSFSVNGFSAALDGARPRALCENARAGLLGAGLLYRGVKC